MKDFITKEQFYNHPIDSVWSAISKGEELSNWFIKADFKPQVGYNYTFTASEEKDCTQITGTVIEADPYTLIYTWVVEGTDTETMVKWVLEATETGTKLTLEHSGISNYPDGDTAITMMGHFDKGWDNCINLLAGYLKEMVHAR